MFTLFHQQYSHADVRATRLRTMWRRFQISNQIKILILLMFSMVLCEIECPTDNNVISVDLNKMAGEWFMVAGTPVTEKVGSCLHFDVQVTDLNEFSMNFTTTSYRNNERLWWKVNGKQKNGVITATWQLSTSPRVLGPFKHQILRIEYNSHLTMVVCAENCSPIRCKIFAMIWSRTQTLPSEDLNNLKKEISRYVNAENIFNVDNTCKEIYHSNELSPIL